MPFLLIPFDNGISRDGSRYCFNCCGNWPFTRSERNTAKYFKHSSSRAIVSKCSAVHPDGPAAAPLANSLIDRSSEASASMVVNDGKAVMGSDGIVRLHLGCR